MSGWMAGSNFILKTSSTKSRTSRYMKFICTHDTPDASHTLIQVWPNVQMRNTERENLPIIKLLLKGWCSEQEGFNTGQNKVEGSLWAQIKQLLMIISDFESLEMEVYLCFNVLCSRCSGFKIKWNPIVHHCGGPSNERIGRKL
jgi:hypothetical protein